MIHPMVNIHLQILTADVKNELAARLLYQLVGGLEGLAEDECQLISSLWLA